MVIWTGSFVTLLPGAVCFEISTGGWQTEVTIHIGIDFCPPDEQD
jgi:hypothetical protein